MAEKCLVLTLALIVHIIVGTIRHVLHYINETLIYDLIKSNVQLVTVLPFLYERNHCAFGCLKQMIGFNHISQRLTVGNN